MNNITRVKNVLVLLVAIFSSSYIAMCSDDECLGMKCKSASGGNCVAGVAVSGGCDFSGLFGCVPKDCTGECTPTIVDAVCVQGEANDVCKIREGSSMGSKCYKICERVGYASICACRCGGATGNGYHLLHKICD